MQQYTIFWYLGQCIFPTGWNGAFLCQQRPGAELKCNLSQLRIINPVVPIAQEPDAMREAAVNTLREAHFAPEVLNRIDRIFVFQPFKGLDIARVTALEIEDMIHAYGLEVADQGIRVNSVRPGFIYTDIHASGGEPGRVDRIKDSIPMKRGGQPEEVAQAILWLLSEQASYATGTFIDLAGGR